MCAITGVYAPDGKAALYAGSLLHFQQNRGQDTSGIYSIDKGDVFWHKGEGMVRDVFGRLVLPEECQRGNVRRIDEFRGNFAVGHNRYRTIGGGGVDNAQPFCTENERFVVVMAHNGHVNNYDGVTKQLGSKPGLEQRMMDDPRLGKPVVEAQERFGLEMRMPDCDVVPILYVFADNLQGSSAIESIVHATNKVMDSIRGGYTVSAFVYDKKDAKTYLVAFKDFRSIRPGFFGQQKGCFAVASETYALEHAGFVNIAPINDREVVIIDESGVHRERLFDFTYSCHHGNAFCQFEQAYFSRALSVVNGRSVNHGRFREGQALARAILRDVPEWVDIADFVTYIPNTPVPIAKGVAKGLNLSFMDCIEKDPYDYKREFITPAAQRHLGTKKGSAVHWDAVCGKNLIVVEDSIVRGETARENVAMLRRAGAVNIYLASGYPRVEDICDMGIDMKTRGELVASGRTNCEIAEFLGIEGVIYLSQEEFERSWRFVDVDGGVRRKIEQGIFSKDILDMNMMCTACVTGKNPTHCTPIEVDC